MEDPQTIAYLEPYTHDAIAIANNLENSRWLIPWNRNPLRDLTFGELSNSLTIPNEDDALTRGPSPCEEESFALRLSFDVESRNGSLGFVFGRQTNTNFPDIVFPDADDISRAHFRIHYNLSCGVLMITDTSKPGTIVGGRFLRRGSIPLMAETTICCGKRDRFGFNVWIPDHTGHQDVYERNYRQYAQNLGCQPSIYLPIPTPALQPIPLGRDYSILEGIGRGKFGVVNTVMRNRDGFVFAIKEIAGEEESGQITFPQEVEIMRKLSHPNIVVFVDAFIWNNAVQVVMERLSMNLDDYRKARPRGQLSLTCIQSVARQTLNGLAYLHEQGIAHRDMKPKNILVATHNDTTNLPTIKLADFGMSSQRPELATFCGTPYYCAPEIYKTNELNKALQRESKRKDKGKPMHKYSYTPAVDIWATGMILHKLLGGKFKQRHDKCYIWYPAETVFEGRKKPAARLVEKMLTEDFEKRPTAPKCLLDPWLIEGANIMKQPQAKRVRSPSPFTEKVQQPLKKVQAAIQENHANFSSACSIGILQDIIWPKGNIHSSNGRDHDKTAHPGALTSKAPSEPLCTQYAGMSITSDVTPPEVMLHSLVARAENPPAILKDNLGPQGASLSMQGIDACQSANVEAVRDDLTDIFCILRPASIAACSATAQIAKDAPRHTIRTAVELNLHGPNAAELAAKGVPSQDIVLRFSADLKEPLYGFCFGRYPRRCDIVISNKKISNVHFRIYIEQSGVIMLEDQSTNGTKVDGVLLRGGDKKNGALYEHLLQQSSLITLIMTPPDEDIKFLVQIPQRKGDYERQYQQNLRDYFTRLDVYRHARDTKQYTHNGKANGPSNGPPHIAQDIEDIDWQDH